MYRIVKSVVLLCAEISREENACARRKTCEKSCQKHGYIRAGADCGECRRAYKLSDYYRVDAVIEILKDLTDKYRQSKYYYQPVYVADSQVHTAFFHFIIPH